MSIIHALMRWILGALAPGTGRRRKAVRPVPVHSVRPSGTPHPAVVGLPVHRSPYGLDTPLDGRAAATVRPYLLDLDPYLIGAEAVA